MIRKKLNLFSIGLLLASLTMSCGDKKDEETKDEDGESVSTVGTISALKEMASRAAELQKNGPVKTVDFRSLKELLPADIDGLARKEANGEKDGAGGFTVSTATGKYANEDGSETIELSLIDGGGSVMTMGLAAWSMIEVDKETKDGYEKTSTIAGNKAYEKYENSSKEGEIAVLVNKRFIISAKGRGVTMEKLKGALGAIDLQKLGALK